MNTTPADHLGRSADASSMLWGLGRHANKCDDFTAGKLPRHNPIVPHAASTAITMNGLGVETKTSKPCMHPDGNSAYNLARMQAEYQPVPLPCDWVLDFTPSRLVGRPPVATRR